MVSLLRYFDETRGWSLVPDASITYAAESANLVFAGPSTGAAAAPTFRALVAADIPAVSSTASLDPATLSGLQLNASSISANTLLKIEIKNNAGNDPTSAAPVIVGFRDATLTGGDPVFLTITAALNIDTHATGATLGVQSSAPFRLWVLLFNNGGTPVLALWHSGAASTSQGVKPLNETTLQSTTAISGSATAAGTFYTPFGTTLTSKAFRILGYVDYVSGLATAGTYSAAPDVVQLMGFGVKKPGDVVQSIYFTNSTVTSVTSSAPATTNLTTTITPTSAINLIRVLANGTARNTTSGTTAICQLRRGAGTSIGNVATTGGTASSAPPTSTATMSVLDNPGVTTSTTYAVYISSSDNTNACSFSTGSTASVMILDEIMG